MSQDISVVQLCHDSWKQRAEALAEAAGFGAGCMSVPLIAADGATWWGCHAWWRQAVMDAYTPPTGDAAANEILIHVMTSAQIGGDPRAHWAAALAEYGLQEVTCSEC